MTAHPGNLNARSKLNANPGKLNARTTFCVILFASRGNLNANSGKMDEKTYTVEPLYSEPPYSESLFIVNEFLGPLKTAILYII